MVEDLGQFKNIQLLSQLCDGFMPGVVKGEAFDAGTSNCFSEKAVSALIGHVQVRGTGADTGSSLRISSARFERGTSRLLSFFVRGRCATEPVMRSGVRLRISPDRMPVSIANKNVAATTPDILVILPS